MVKRFRSMTYPYIAWIIAIIVVPMLLIVLYAFTTSGNSVLTFQFTFENFARFVTDKVFMDVLLRSLYIALITTLICVALGYPIAYVIAQRRPQQHDLNSAHHHADLGQYAGAHLCLDGHFAGRGHLQHDPFVVRHRPRVDDPHELCRHPRHGL